MDELLMQILKNRILWLAYVIYRTTMELCPEKINWQVCHEPFEVKKDGLNIKITLTWKQQIFPGFDDVQRCTLLVWDDKWKKDKKIKFWTEDPKNCQAQSYSLPVYADETANPLPLYKKDLERIYSALQQLAYERGNREIHYP